MEFARLDAIDFDKFWLLSDGHCLSTQVKKICDNDMGGNKTGINFDFKTGSIASLIRFVKINRGVTILPYLASLELSSREHRKVSRFEPPVPVRTIGLIVHKHFVKRELIKMLQSEIQHKILPLLRTEQEEMVVSPL